MVSLLTALMLSLPTSGAQGGAVEIDRVLSTVHATKIWRSDVRQARLLKLCPPATTDEAILVALENRLLIMAEVSRSPQPYDPPADEVARHRGEWEATLGGGASVTDLLGKAGMTAPELEAWLRGDLKIRKYIEQRFGALPAAERQTRIDEWTKDLRQRAGLKG
jgi:hypothetical protein